VDILQPKQTVPHRSHPAFHREREDLAIWTFYNTTYCVDGRKPETSGQHKLTRIFRVPILLELLWQVIPSMLLDHVHTTLLGW